MATIYHASDKIISKIKNPEKEKIGYRKDFGYGFYCTRIKKQAERWNELKYDNRGIVNIFLYDEEISKNEFWEKVRFNKLTNQICFLTEKAIKFLEFKGVGKIEKR